jgi:hypothetical protein
MPKEDRLPFSSANMKHRLPAMLAAALLLPFSSATHSITISRAAIENGQISIAGSNAPKLASIQWDGESVGKKSNSNGTFSFNTTDLPKDCVGRLKIGSANKDVVIKHCRPAAVFKSGVPKTGQTTSALAGDDGDLQKGIESPDPRFTDNSDGTVSDNLTGLRWLKDANCPDISPNAWHDALAAVGNLADGACGLSDGSSAGDWRLPNRNELLSLLDMEQFSPALPSAHPFANLQASYYWSSTTSAATTFVFLVNFDTGVADFGGFGDFVIAVRGGP